MSAILQGAWRDRPDPLDLPEDLLVASLPVLTSNGAGGLAWNRIKDNPALADSAAGRELHKHAQLLAIEAARHETALGALIGVCDAAGMTPLLFKGRAAAQFYDKPSLRRMGDADLCASPGQFDEMTRVLQTAGFRELHVRASEAHGRAILLESPADWPGKKLLVDLHERLDEFFLFSMGDVFARAQGLRVGERSILMPAQEDHLRIAIIHFLRDGGWRPLSLCDVGALLESVPPAFDWELCCGDHPRHRRWITCTFELAHQLLAARLDAVPAGLRVSTLPSWLRATVLRAWDKPLSHHRPRVAFHWILRRQRRYVLSEALARWPNGLRASVELDAEFNLLPRWPYQLLAFLRALGKFLTRGPHQGSI